MELLGRPPSLLPGSGKCTTLTQAEVRIRCDVQASPPLTAEYRVYAYATIIMQVVIYGFRPIHRIKLRHLPGITSLEQMARCRILYHESQHLWVLDPACT